MTIVVAPHIDYDGRALVASWGVHQPRRIHLHDTESHDAKGIRDLAGIATYWHGVAWGPGAHVGVDSEGFSARYVDDRQIAYHTQNRNTGALGIEIVGFARFARNDWLAREAQLDEVAQWLAHWGTVYEIPLVQSLEHGVSTHAQQSKAFGGSHYDPGPGFPFAEVMVRAQAKVKASSAPRPKPVYAEASYWLWLRWWLGEGEFTEAGPHAAGARPASLPDRIPPTWHARRLAFVQKRNRAKEATDR